MATLPQTLDAWLDHQQRVHPREIALGLERVRAVWQRMGAPAPAPVVISIGGTNGKGSTVAFLEAMLREAGHRVGAFTSPHLLRYNERVRVAGVDVDDATFVRVFDRIEDARGDIPLTYFEYGTLAALWIFSQSGLDVALLEVGLGGRLDAVNIVDADVAIVTTVDLDHQDWLGNDRDSIGREKAGIFRSGRVAVIGERAPPPTLLAEAHRIGAEVRRAGVDFEVAAFDHDWRWRSGTDELTLPMPQLAAPCQIDNAAAAIAALHALRERIGWNPAAIAAGVAGADVGARLQRFAGEPEFVIDVAHNPQAARVLAAWLHRPEVRRRTFAVFGALADKDVTGIVDALATGIDGWFLAGLDGDSPRGLDGTELRDLLARALPTTAIHGVDTSVDAALRSAFRVARSGDRVLAFGSFFVAAAALRFVAAEAAFTKFE